VEAGLLDESEAMSHVDRHLVSNVGGVEEMRVEIGSSRKLAQRDGVLVASDGLLDTLLVDELAGMLSRGDAETAATRLSTLAWSRMKTPEEGLPTKPDDLSLIVYTQRGVKAEAAPA
jgi:serine/threonine protein phosphatase PrpC